jgi:hypothetical protein
MNLTGKTCERCKEGTYAERSIHDDWDGKLTCDKCNHRIDKNPNKNKLNNMNTKTYIEKSKDKEILNHILLHIVDDTSSQRENEFARAIEKSTDGKITKEEFHDWIADFDINSYIN